MGLPWYWRSHEYKKVEFSKFSLDVLRHVSTSRQGNFSWAIFYLTHIVLKMRECQVRQLLHPLLTCWARFKRNFVTCEILAKLTEIMAEEVSIPSTLARYIYYLNKTNTVSWFFDEFPDYRSFFQNAEYWEFTHLQWKPLHQISIFKAFLRIILSYTLHQCLDPNAVKCKLSNNSEG